MRPDIYIWNGIFSHLSRLLARICPIENASSVMLACFAFITIDASAQEPLDIVSWGGSYAASQRAAYIDRFAKRHPVQIHKYNGGINELRQAVLGKRNWDVIDLTDSDNTQACALGLLEPISYADLAPSSYGRSAKEDFTPGSSSACGIAHNIYATVISYKLSSFPGIKPTLATDLFDIEKFPGKRALQKTPAGNLEWALLAYGVPLGDLYRFLSTERGVSLALKKLDSIRDQIVWWELPEESLRLLATAEVSFATGYNGRFYGNLVEADHSIEIIWDGQIYEYSTWGIVRNASEKEAAFAFVRFATTTENMARLTQYIPYGPTRRSAFHLIHKNPQSGQDIRPHLPTTNAKYSRAIRKDHQWYAKTILHLEEKFQQWLATE